MQSRYVLYHTSRMVKVCELLCTSLLYSTFLNICFSHPETIVCKYFVKKYIKKLKTQQTDIQKCLYHFLRHNIFLFDIHTSKFSIQNVLKTYFYENFQKYYTYTTIDLHHQFISTQTICLVEMWCGGYYYCTTSFN